MSTLLETGRTHSCGALREGDVGREVILFGWVHRRRPLGGRLFVQLRDRDGLTQLSFAPEIDARALELAEDLRSEDCIGIRGTVLDRGENKNSEMATGAIEVAVRELEVFSKSETPPFVVADDDRLDAQENLRLRYRYLDLRRPVMQRNFKIRSQIGIVSRAVLSELGFYELETPCLVKYTPGGARNFLVPSRLHPTQFYALAESPQIYKQLLMVAGMDKYFQITRCFRDEDLRFDRQPEFTQIDVELSFATPPRVFEAMETLVRRLWNDVLGVELPGPFLRMTWDEALGRFGSDKPDTRFGLELCNVTALTRATGFRVFDDAPCVSGICLPPEHAQGMSRAQIDKLTAFVKQREQGGAKGLAWTKVASDGAFDGGIARNVPAETQRAIVAAMKATPGCLLLWVADDWDTTHTALCNLRLELRDRLGLVSGAAAKAWNFLWVTDFPLMERNTDGRWVACHHPFTSPRLDQLHLLESDPGQVRAQAYDLVLNGNEVGGGSIRIHRSDVQAKVFAALGLSDAEAQQKFGFLLDAFRYGPPPHGGIAFGLDRLAMLMCGAESLRDVIAFPKTQRGQDLMTQCPTPVDEPQLAELFLTHRPLAAEPTPE